MRHCVPGRAGRRDAASSVAPVSLRIRTLPASLPRTTQHTPATRPHHDRDSSLYDPIARLYDPWSVSITEDVEFYVELALEAGGPVVELGVGTGRIAVPTAAAGVRVIGVDSSRGMLEVCAEAAATAGVAHLVDLQVRATLRAPPVSERVRLVTCPFRAYLHLHTAEERLRALRAARELLAARGAARLRRLRARRRRHRGDERPLAGARARDLRARGLGHRAPSADAVGARPARSDVDGARLDCRPTSGAS